MQFYHVMNVVIKTSISGDSNYFFLQQVVFIFSDIGLFTEIRPKETCNFFLFSLPFFHANTNPVCVTHDVPIPGIAVLNAFGFLFELQISSFSAKLLRLKNK